MTTDGKAVEKVSGTRKEVSRMYWEGDILVLSESVNGSLGEATNIVHYRLIEGGRILIADERATGPRAHENHWVFERAAAAR